MHWWMEQFIIVKTQSCCKVDRAAAAKERTKGLLEIREALNAVIQRQLDDAPDEEIQSLQRQLETAYDAFSKKFA